MASPNGLDAAIALQLFRSIAAHTNSYEGTTCNLHVPLSPGVIEAAAGLMRDKTFLSGGGMMFRTVNDDSLFRALLPEMTDRWTALGKPFFSVGIENPDGPPISISGSSGGISLGPADELRCEVIAQDKLFALVFGLQDPETLDLPGQAAAGIKVLVPQQRGTFLSADDF